MSIFYPLAAAPISARPTGAADDQKVKKERDRLKEACQDFEAILLAELWKKMASNARELGGKKDRDRPFGALEDLSVEMSAEYLTKSGGAGMGKMLYDSLVVHLDGKENTKGASA